ncbi:MAG: hypothetical protein ABFD16_09855 [Thermoguttaceae bacterium]
MDSQQLESVRGTVLSTLASLGIPKAPWFLVTNGRPPRRREVIGNELPPSGIRVVWQVEKHRLEFFDQEDSRLLTTVPVTERPEGFEAS